MRRMLLKSGEQKVSSGLFAREPVTTPFDIWLVLRIDICNWVTTGHVMGLTLLPERMPERS
jgi:hypothetical protein